MITTDAQQSLSSPADATDTLGEFNSSDLWTLYSHYSEYDFVYNMDECIVHREYGWKKFNDPRKLQLIPPSPFINNIRKCCRSALPRKIREDCSADN